MSSLTSYLEHSNMSCGLPSYFSMGAQIFFGGFDTCFLGKFNCIVYGSSWLSFATLLPIIFPSGGVSAPSTSSHHPRGNELLGACCLILDYDLVDKVDLKEFRQSVLVLCSGGRIHCPSHRTLAYIVFLKYLKLFKYGYIFCATCNSFLQKKTQYSKSFKSSIHHKHAQKEPLIERK